MPALGAGARESVRVRIPPPARLEFTQVRWHISGRDRTAAPTFAHTFPASTSRARAVRHRVEVGVEQVGIDPQCHTRVFVPEHPRQSQHVDARTNCQRGAGVPQIVWRDGLHPGSFDRTGEPTVRRLRPLQILTMPTGEHQGIGSLALALCRQFVADEFGHRDRPCLTALGRSDNVTAADLHGVG